MGQPTLPKPDRLLGEGVLRSCLFAQAPDIHPDSSLIKGVVCGVRVAEVDDPLMQKIRYLDKLVVELAKGKSMEKILRRPAARVTCRPSWIFSTSARRFRPHWKPVPRRPNKRRCAGS